MGWVVPWIGLLQTGSWILILMGVRSVSVLTRFSWYILAVEVVIGRYLGKGEVLVWRVLVLLFLTG
jgi:hypothetical protein